VLAVASVAFPYSPAYDPWAWLGWGRELLDLELDTAGGPSWKPLPVLFTAPASLLGDASPDAWLALARFGWMTAAVLAAWVAAGLVAPNLPRRRWIAAALAGGSVALSADSLTPPARQFAGGLSEPLLVALALGGLAAAMRDRNGLALLLALAAALLRPEAWPFLIGYCLWLGARGASLRPACVAALLVVPAAWFLPDLLGSGDPSTGAGIARGEGSPPWEVSLRALAAPLAPLWVGAVAIVLLGHRDGDRRPGYMLGMAGAWILLVVVMALAGFAGIPRFLAPATALVSVLGAAGLARLLAGTEEGRRRGVAALLVAVAAAQLGWRATEVPGDLAHAHRSHVEIRELERLVERAGRDRLLACAGEVTVDRLLVETALAWQLEAPASKVEVRMRPRQGGAVVQRVPAGSPRPFARYGRWAALALPCPAQPVASSASRRRIAGVSGTTR
jgi:hypothetical protein